MYKKEIYLVNKYKKLQLLGLKSFKNADDDSACVATCSAANKSETRETVLKYF